MHAAQPHTTPTSDHGATTHGNPTMDKELAVLRCLLSAKATAVLTAVDHAGLEAHDFHSETRRDVFKAIMATARRASDAGQGEVEVSPLEVTDTLERAGGDSMAAHEVLLTVSTGNPYSGTTDNLWVLDQRVMGLKRERMWRGVDHIATALHAVWDKRDMAQLRAVLDQVAMVEEFYRLVQGGENAA